MSERRKRRERERERENSRKEEKRRKKLLTHGVGGVLAELLEGVGLGLRGLLVGLGGGDFLDLFFFFFVVVGRKRGRRKEVEEVGRNRVREFFSLLARCFFFPLLFRFSRVDSSAFEVDSEPQSHNARDHVRGGPVDTTNCNAKRHNALERRSQIAKQTNEEREIASLSTKKKGR